jgi:hypothetical protein
VVSRPVLLHKLCSPFLCRDHVSAPLYPGKRVLNTSGESKKGLLP